MDRFANRLTENKQTNQKQTSSRTKLLIVSHLILLFEAIALGTLHLGDVLQEVGHTDRRMQLSSLVGNIHRLPLLEGVGVGLHQAAGIAGHRVGLVYEHREKERRGQ